MGMTHLLARMKSLLREQNAWQGYDGNDEAGSDQAGPALDSLPEGLEDNFEQAAEDEVEIEQTAVEDHVRAADDSHLEPLDQAETAEIQAPDQEASVPDPASEEEQPGSVHGHEHVSAPNELTAQMQGSQEGPDQGQRLSVTHLADEHLDGGSEGQIPQAEANFTHNPVYTTSPSTPAAGHPRMSMLASTRVADTDSKMHQQTGTSAHQPSAEAQGSTGKLDANNGPWAASRFAPAQASSQPEYVLQDLQSGRTQDASGMSRDELIATIQELEQLVAAGQMALAETEERLALSQHRLQVSFEKRYCTSPAERR